MASLPRVGGRSAPGSAWPTLRTRQHRAALGGRIRSGALVMSVSTEQNYPEKVIEPGRSWHDLRLAESIIEGRINQLWLDAEARRLIAIDGNGELWGV